MQDWTQFRLRVFIKAPMQKVYDAWAKPGLIETWYLEEADYFSPDGAPRAKDEYTRKGDTYRWKWYNWSQKEEGRVLEANGKDLIELSFAGDAKVSLQLEVQNGKTHLILTQSNIPTDEKSKKNIYNGCSLGWSFWMVNLKAWLEHGILLNDTELGEDKENLHEIVNS